MTFKDYIASLPKEERPRAKENVRKITGASVSCVKHWANGTRKPSVKNLTAIKTATGLSREQLRPDIYA